MKLIKKLQHYKSQGQIFLSNNNIYLERFSKFLFIFFILILCSAGIWLAGDQLHWGSFSPFAEKEKKFYIILFLWLIWLLKFLIFDLSDLNPAQFKDVKLRKKLQKLKEQFYFILHFLNKTHHDHGKLSDNPLLLVIGPSGSGKTTLLNNSAAHFILKCNDNHSLSSSHQSSESSVENDCDWRITRDLTFIDVPGSYLSLSRTAQKRYFYPLIWDFFLHGIKKIRDKKNLDGILITLPMPELMQLNDTKKYHHLLVTLGQRLDEIKHFFPLPIPYYLLITKCDLLSGFNEFFAESSIDEINKAWGITLSAMPQFEDHKKIQIVLLEKFNELIKKLNQQLIWRLHQERNPMARPYIKDFPFQVENLKNAVMDFIKKFPNPDFIHALQGIYLTSAKQEILPQEKILNEPIDTVNRDIQLFKEPTPHSRAYFIKHFITYHLKHKPELKLKSNTQFKLMFAIASSMVSIVIVALFLIKDFNQSVSHINAMTNEVSTYQIQLQFHDAYQKLNDAVTLIENLQNKANTTNKYDFDFAKFFSFYANKSQKTINVLYQKGTADVLKTAIKNYLEDYLRDPVNKNLDSIYNILKAYLMLGNNDYFQANFVVHTLLESFPASADATEQKRLITHIQHQLTHWQPLELNQSLIQKTREFLTTTPGFQLSFIILRNINNNYAKSEVNLGQNADIIFQKNGYLIPHMYTVKLFSHIFSQETNIATQETILGNWVLGNFNINNNPKIAGDLLEQLRSTYITNYAKTWENFLLNLHIVDIHSLKQVDAIISVLIGSQSPLLQLLQIIYENTYFDPVISASQTLKNLSLLIAKDSSSANNLLFEIFTSLHTLQKKIQDIMNAENEKKAAFELITERAQHPKIIDVFTQLHLTADKSPEPIKTWLNQLTNTTWHLVSKDANLYLDVSQNILNGERNV